MSGIEGGGTKKPEAPSNIISHRFRELKQPASLAQLINLTPWKVRIVMRERKPITEELKSQFPFWHPIHKEPTTSTPQIDPEFTPHNEKRYPKDRTLVNYDEIDAWRQQLNGRTVHKNPDVIKAIQESDMKRSESVDNLHETNKLWFVTADADGRVVFLSEERFDHIAFEIRKYDWSTRFEQFVMSWIINNDMFNFLQLIYEVVTTGDIEEITEEWWKKPGYSYRKVFKVEKLVKQKNIKSRKVIVDRNVQVVTSVNGMIVTVKFEEE